MINNCLYYKPSNNPNDANSISLRLVVPPSLVKAALMISHDTPIAGHFGVKKSLQRSRSSFFWPNQFTDVCNYISRCEICQKRNFQGMRKAKIKALPVVTQPLQRVGIDLIGKLSPSRSGNCYILTIVDHFTRFVQAYPLPNKQSATVSKAFMDFVCRYGCPEHVVSDRGSEFTSNVFHELLKSLKSKLHLTTSFHPQSNGMTESFNKLLKNTLLLSFQRCKLMFILGMNNFPVPY